MAVRDRQGLIDQAAVLFPDRGDTLIQASELRSFITDLVDSLAFASAITGAEIVRKVNAELGSTTWQQGSGTVTGVTLAQVIAAVVIDNTPVGQLRLARNTSATEVEIALESVAAHTMTRYAAASADAVFTASEWLTGNTSTDETIAFPVTAMTHHKGFAVPASVTSLTVIQQVGSPFNSRGSYAPVVGDPDVLADIGGESHKTYIQVAPDGPLLAPRNYMLR